VAKGIFTQGMSLLTDGRTAIADVRSALSRHGFEIVKETPGSGEWAYSGPSVVVAYLPDVNGYAAVDVVDRPWPDAMGDPASGPTTFAAWSMGHFGPFAYPGGLARAEQHGWAWPPAKGIADGHQGFIRLRISYVFGAGEGKPIQPRDYDPVAELMFLGRAVVALFEARGVICCFNPNGEVLRDRASFRAVWDACVAHEQLPLPLWSNIRFFKLDDGLGFMDTVGNGQLDLSDVEAIFPSASYDPADVDYYLRNVTLYLRDLDRDLRPGEAIDGPGESGLSWTMEVLDGGIVAPPRRVVRLYPRKSAAQVRKVLATVGTRSR
jgi:hypothetical protein